MPIEIIELAKLILGIMLFIIPGYLWSFLFLKKSSITRLERIMFGFVLSLSLFILSFFAFDLILKIPVTFAKTLFVYFVYTGVIIVLFLVSIKKKGLPKQTKAFISTIKQVSKNPRQTVKENRTVHVSLLLFGILIFAFFMGFLPHLKESFYLPFHVDEWIHWTRTESMMETGFTEFINPWLGRGIDRSLEPGFNYMIGSLSWLTGVSFNTMFIFMPALITVFTSFAAFNLGNKFEKPFGLEAAVFIPVIPTTCRMMGPSFFVPVATGLFFLIFLLWFLQLKKPLILSLFIPIGLWTLFLIHPPTALAGIIITFIYAVMLVFDKKLEQSALHLVYAFIPIGGAFALSARYGASIQQVIDAFLGGTYYLGYNLPEIWVSFEHMGVLVWILAIVGVYFAFSKGKTIIHSIGFSALAFLTLIGLYNKFDYGIPIMYERSFMYLFLMICLLAGWGLATFRRSITDLILDYLPVKNGKVQVNTLIKKTSIAIPFIVFVLLVFTTVPAHQDISYYTMINETDFKTYNWIRENIDSYQNNTIDYDRASVDPYKASPFSAVTRLYIVSSTMHPIPGYKYHQDVESFLSNCCENESFFKEFDVSVVYTTGCCTNQNLNEIYPNVYIVSGED